MGPISWIAKRYVLEGSLDVLIEEAVLSSLQLLEDETILDDEKLEKVIVRISKGSGFRVD